MMQCWTAPSQGYGRPTQRRPVRHTTRREKTLRTCDGNTGSHRGSVGTGHLADQSATLLPQTSDLEQRSGHVRVWLGASICSAICRASSLVAHDTLSRKGQASEAPAVTRLVSSCSSAREVDQDSKSKHNASGRRRAPGCWSSLHILQYDSACVE